MPLIPVKVPSVGESITEGILARWFKSDGAAVKEGEKLYELETDKVTQEIHSTGSGVLKIKVPEGEKVEIGQEVAAIDPEGTPAEAAAPAATPKESAPAAGAAAPASPPSGDIPLSPATRRAVAETGVDPAAVEGTGRGGRLTKGDVLAAAEKAGSNAAPAAPKVSAPPVAPPAASAPPAPAGQRESRERMSNLRQRIAQRLVEAQQTAAILTTFNEVDMSRVMAIRSQFKDAFKAKNGVNLGFMSFFVKACIEALKAFPRVNARIEGNEIVQCHYYDIGVAVSTEKGLMVPVVRDADKKSFADIEKGIVQYATKAREGRIEVSDLQGGTFTITNGGVFGSLLSTPIINPPQSGILGMHSIKERPVAIDGQVVIRPMMYLALSYDHRIIDGREAVSFLVRIKECIEDPERILLDI